MTSAEAREKAFKLAEEADSKAYQRSGATLATLALFWHREAGRLEEDENIEVIVNRGSAAWPDPPVKRKH